MADVLKTNNKPSEPDRIPSIVSASSGDFFCPSAGSENVLSLMPRTISTNTIREDSGHKTTLQLKLEEFMINSGQGEQSKDSGGSRSSL